MKSSLTKTLALVAVGILPGGTAMAQSVLERVLGQIDNASNLAQVNGTFANIAENVGTYVPGPSTTTSVPATLETAPPETIIWRIDTGLYLTAGDIGTTFTPGDSTEVGAFLASAGVNSITFNLDGSVTIDPGTGSIDLWEATTANIRNISGAAQTVTLNVTDAFVYTGYGNTYLINQGVAEDEGGFTLIYADVTTELPGYVISPDIDASINNVISGVGDATAEAIAGSVTATEFVIPTVDLGDMSTTGLGAVNTGDITLGVNAAVDEASTATTNAISAAMTQIGGSADTGAIVINVASNAGAINGSINNVLDQINGSIGNLSTTALGAVNTGTITSGVDAAVQGIVGMSGQTSSGL